MKKQKKVEPFLVLGPILIAPIVPQVYTRMWQGHFSKEEEGVLECIAEHDEHNGSLVDVCFIRKQELLDLYGMEHMSMLDMCMYVVDRCRDEGGRLCPPQLWSQFASVYMDERIPMPEHVSLIMPEILVVSKEAPRGVGITHLHYDLAWRRCSCGEIEPRLPIVSHTCGCERKENRR